MPPPDGAAITFAEKLLALLDQGKRSATYKYAVLLGLMDLCLEQTSHSGTAPEMVTTRQLAEKVFALYWLRGVAFRRDHVLRQSGAGQAEIVTTIRRFRDRHRPDPSATLTQARAAAPVAYETLVRSIEWKLVEMPLPRLQVLGTTLFLSLHGCARVAQPAGPGGFAPLLGRRSGPPTR
jgi:hypothetical protein